MKRPHLLAAALLLVFPAGAWAQEAPRTDPQVGSPAEAVYGIPLEEARRDGAPGALPEPAIRSENGVGSSSIVPGTAHDLPADSDAGREARGGRRETRRLDPELASTRLSGDPAPGPMILLLLLVVLIAAAGGAFAGRRA
jgi:hypothetical protein